MKKIIGITIVCIMILQILSIFVLPVNAKFNEETNELFWNGNSKIKKDNNENKIKFKEYSHLLTLEEMNELKKHVGVYNKNKNYNIKYNGLGTGLAPPSNEEWNIMVGTVNVVDNNMPSLPSASSIDLSTEPYFPIVRSQGLQGSCASWAATYYANGYVQAKNNGWNEASMGNNNHLLSPAFTYNKCNYGEDSGSHTWTNGYVMQDIGVCTWNEMPYDQNDDVGWGNENAWRDAPQYRINDIYMLNSYFDDADINTIKNAVDSGYPVTFALHASSYNNFGSDDVLDLSGMVSSYNHANTIVGYDDTITDSESGEVGAFKCVNSWGSTWGPASNGYYWMTYNAFKGSQNVYPVCWFGDLYTDSDPKLLGVWELNPQSDRDANIELGIGSYSSPLGTRTPWLDGHSGTMHSYPSFMCLDITEFYNDWISNSNNFYLEFSNSLYNDGTISSFKIEYYDISYITGSPTQISPESEDVPLTTPGYVETQFSQTETNFPPACTITANPNSGYVHLTTTFTMSANDPDGSIASWELDVDNDGNADYSGSGNPPLSEQHTYTAAGEYTAELTVWDNEEATGIDITIVNVYWVPPSITITYPNGGETFYAGNNYDITWSTTPGSGSINGINLEYSTDAGSIYKPIVTGTQDDRSHTWMVPDDSGTQCLIRGTVHDDNSETGTDISDSHFEIIGIPPGPPTNLNVVHYGESSVIDTSDSVSINKGTEQNDYTYTHTLDSSYHEITEVRVGGSARNPKLGAEVVYTISITGSSAPYTLNIDAYHNDDETYDISYQVNGLGYTTLGQITAGGYQSWELSGVNNGDTFKVMIRDTIRSAGETRGTLYVDHLYIESGGGGGGTEDNKLTWDRSPDDGIGADGVSYYNIYRSNINGEPWNYINQVTADNSLSYTYIDVNAGTADSTLWWYVVRAVDTGGLESANSNSAQEPGVTNNPPNTPSNPNPADSATNVNINADLSWTGGDPDAVDTVEYDVYFGTSPIPPILGTVTSETYDPGTLSYNTQYYWQIVSRDNHGAETPGPVWSFTTEDQGPSGGIYVWDISWREKQAGKNTFLYYTVTVRRDSDGDGVAESSDALVPDATVHTKLTQIGTSNLRYHSGITDLNGQIELGEKVQPGDYIAEVTSITHSSYSYNSALDVDNPDTYTIN